MEPSKRVKILGSHLHMLTMEETLVEVENLILGGGYTQHTSINASKINLMEECTQLKQIINSCQIINADGQSIVWAGRYLGHKIPERVTGIDLFQNLIKIAEEKGWSVFYLGATEEVVKTVVKKHSIEYPKLRIAGFNNGYFTNEEEREIVKKIRESNTDLLFVGFSSPQKEFWINKYQTEANVKFAMGVGGSFDIIAGKTKRAPKWLQKCGLEWFYRFMQEPIRMFNRYIIGNLKFIRLVFQEKNRKKI